MLISFSVSNFKSIGDEVEFSMLASEVDHNHPENLIELPDKRKVLKSALIYGANASGKSNLIKAIKIIPTLFFSTHENQQIENWYSPFRLNSQYSLSPTKLRYEFLAENSCYYIYEIVYDSSGVIKERLEKITEAKNSILFERNKIDGNKASSSLIEQNLLNFQKSEKSNSKVFLLAMRDLGIEDLKDVVAFFQSIINLDQSTFNLKHEADEDMFAEMLNYLEPHGLEVFTEFLKYLDIGLDGINVRNVPTGLGSFQKMIGTFRRSHDLAEPVAFDLMNESEGTIALLPIVFHVIATSNLGRLLIVDEIDRSIHLDILKAIFRYFQSSHVNKKGAQLIAPTHNMGLLNSGLFRRDQIWIVNKDEQGISKYTSLSDYEEIKEDDDFEKIYSLGLVGGKPIIDEYKLWMNHDAEAKAN